MSNDSTYNLNQTPQNEPQPSISQKHEIHNIVIFITDQDSAAVAERWPESFEDEHLPATKRLKQNGLTFSKMFTVTSACSPSRATLLTSTYPSQNDVVNTIAVPSSIQSWYRDYGQAFPQYFLQPYQVNLAHVLKARGYKVYWKGKWHLGHPVNGTDQWTESDIAYLKQTYGFDGWNPIDAGVDRQDPKKFGKGPFLNDERYVHGVEEVRNKITKTNKQMLKEFEEQFSHLKEEGIIEFIKNYQPEDGPFCLVVSLVNPHDIHVAPSFDPDAGYSIEDFENLNLPIPDTVDEDLSFKPEIQEIFREGCRVTENARRKSLKDGGQEVWYGKSVPDDENPLENKDVQQMFVNFYGYLKKLVDSQMNQVLDALDGKGLIDNTLIVKTSDHGEMCLTHGGQREKAFNAYEETIRVPLIISNPRLFPKPKQTDALVCTLDLVPTLAKFIGVYDLFKFSFQGCDLTPLFNNTKGKVLDGDGEVRDCIHFTYDDGFLPNQFNLTPRRIRTIRTEEWKYSVYFNDGGSNYEFELYNLKNDPFEEHNLAGNYDDDCYEQFRNLHQKLQEKMVKLKTVPETFSVYTKTMEENNFKPPLYWPTPDTAFYEAFLDHGANNALYEYRKYSKDIKPKLESQTTEKEKITERKQKIQTMVKDIPDGNWWMGT